MHFWTTIVLHYLAVNALAQFIYSGSDSDLVIDPLVKNASRVTADLYKHCKFEHEGVVIRGEACVGEAVKIMIAFMSNAVSAHQGDDEAVVLLNSIGVGDEVLQTTIKESSTTTAISFGASLDSPRPKPKRDASKAEELLENFNNRLHRRSGGREDIRAVGLDHATAQSKGGLAVRTNVRSDDAAALYVYSNASHATAAFEKDPSLSIGRRTISYDQGVELNGMQGFKLEARWVDKDFRLDEVEAALLNFVSGNVSSVMPQVPLYTLSDAWAFVSCGKTHGRTNDQIKLQGKLISLDGNAGNDFENGGLINCDRFKEAQ
jgi:hypothetical protein